MKNFDCQFGNSWLGCAMCLGITTFPRTNIDVPTPTCEYRRVAMTLRL